MRFQARVGAFLQGLAILGWTIGRNVRVDTRWATSNAAEFADKRGNWLRSRRRHPGPWFFDRGAVAAGDPQRANRVRIVVDPVGSGFVESLARRAGTPPVSWCLNTV